MATTAKGTPYVESTDLVANYPAASLALANHIDDNTGKILQVVRATDSTDRSTTNASFVDADISVTITPTKTTSNILLIWTSSTNVFVFGNTFAAIGIVITDSSNNSISGQCTIQIESGSANPNGTGTLSTFIAFDSPGSISPKTYKGRFRKAAGGTAGLANATYTGQMYAIEVSA